MIKRIFSLCLLIGGYVYFMTADKNSYLYTQMQKYVGSQIKEIKNNSEFKKTQPSPYLENSKKRSRWF